MIDYATKNRHNHINKIQRLRRLKARRKHQQQERWNTLKAKTAHR